MKKEFDPKTHRFGMAYRSAFGPLGERVVYISDITRGVPTLLIDAKDQNRSYTAYSYDEPLTRSPEHDLIPRAVADKLAEALIAANEQIERLEMDVEDLDESDLKQRSSWGTWTNDKIKAAFAEYEANK